MVYQKEFFPEIGSSWQAWVLTILTLLFSVSSPHGRETIVLDRVDAVEINWAAKNSCSCSQPKLTEAEQWFWLLLSGPS